MRLVCYIWFESNTAICFGGGHASFPTHTHITLVYELCAENICAQFPRQAHEIQAVCSVNSQKGVRTQKKKVRCVRGARMCAQKMAKYNQKGKKTSATCTCECILISSERIVLRVEYNTPPHFMDWQSDSDSDNIYKYFYNLTSFAHVSPHSLCASSSQRELDNFLFLYNFFEGCRLIGM